MSGTRISQLASFLSHSSMEQKDLPLNPKTDETNLLQFTQRLSFSVAEQKLCKELSVPTEEAANLHTQLFYSLFSKL